MKKADMERLLFAIQCEALGRRLPTVRLARLIAGELEAIPAYWDPPTKKPPRRRRRRK